MSLAAGQPTRWRGWLDADGHNGPPMLPALAWGRYSSKRIRQPQRGHSLVPGVLWGADWGHRLT